MVIKNKAPAVAGRGRARAPPLGDDVIVVRSNLASSSNPVRLEREVATEPADIIDLGAPRFLRQVHSARPPTARQHLLQRVTYAPNPRLYPGPPRAKPKAPKRTEGRGGGEGRGRRRKRSFRRPVPNSRLYRPAPVRPAPPAEYPRDAWSPPAPSARLDSASRAALHLAEQRRACPPPAPAAPRRPPRARPSRPAPRPRPRPACERASPGRASPPTAVSSPSPGPPPKLVVTLPAAGAALLPRYHPASQHFRLRTLDTESGESTPVAGRPCEPLTAAPTMDAGNRHSTSPEDWSDGNETSSAPSEFLAEFLSAIMRRQYAEALKYCRLILQYEPHNATARGFYPLLQHKVQAQQRPDEEGPRGSSSEEASAPASDPPRHPQEMMEQGGDTSEGSEEEGDESRSSSASRSAGSCGSQSSLELDSSEALAHSSPSLSLSRHTEHTEHTEHTDSGSGGRWESSPSRSDADDNGNAKSAAAPRLCAGDLENDNAAAAGEPLSVARTKSESPAESLRRLRAQFTCSIK